MSIFMSALRILIPGLQLWMYILPGFALAVILSILFPIYLLVWHLTPAALLRTDDSYLFSCLCQGIAAEVPTADMVSDGFGMIAIVAMMPIVAVEILGALYQFKLRKASEKTPSAGIPVGGHNE